MNKLLADLTVLYTKLHTFHYNITGSDFYSVHVMLEGEYDTIHNWIDEVAESMKIEGEYPVASIKEMLELTTITEAESKDYKSKEILEAMLVDYEALIKDINAIKEEQSMIQENMLEEIITYLAKQVWFIKATLK